MTYEELKQAVQDYLESAETKFVSNIPLFVKQTENRVYSDPSIQIPALRKNVTGQMTAGNKYVATPTDFLSAFSLAVIDPETGEYDYPELKDVNLIREVYPSPTHTGRPKFYSLFSPNTLIVGPTPDKSYGVELHYFYYPQTLVTAGQSWLATNFPSVMLYGVVAEAYRFQKGDAAQQKVYDDQFQQACMALRGHSARTENEAYRNVQPKPSVQVGE